MAADASRIKDLVKMLSLEQPASDFRATKELVTMAHDPEKGQLIGKAGAVEPLVKLIKRGSAGTAAKENAANVLWGLTLHSECAKQMVEAGAIEGLVELLKTGSDEAKDRAGNVLQNLATDSTYRQAIGEGGGIEALVDLLKLGQAGCQSAAGALQNLSGEWTNVQRFIDAGGIELLVTRLAGGNDAEKRHAFVVLENLAINSVNKQQIVRGGAIEPLLKLMGRTDDLKDKAGGALQKLGFTPEDIDRLIKQYSEGKAVSIVDDSMAEASLKTLAPDVPGVGLFLFVAGKAAEFDPLKVAPAVVSALEAVYQACTDRLVFRNQVTHLQERIVVFRPFVKGLQNVVEKYKDSPYMLGQNILPCTFRLLTVLNAAEKLLGRIPNDRYRFVRVLRELLKASDFQKQFDELNTNLNECAADVNACITMLNLSQSMVQAESDLEWKRRTEVDRKADMAAVAKQVQETIDSDREGFNKQLEKERVGLRSWLDELEAAGAGRHAVIVGMLEGLPEKVVQGMEKPLKDVVDNIGSRVDASRDTLREDIGMLEKLLIAGITSDSKLPVFAILFREIKVHKERLLGAGGFGKVYLGTYKNQAVAVKVFEKAWAFNRTQRQQVFKEAYTLSRIDNDYVVGFYGMVWDPQGEYHLAMVTEHIQGEPLSDIAHDIVAMLTLQQKLMLCLEAAKAVRALHHYPPPYGPIIHGDIKPGNMMVCDGKVKLLDFGCSRISYQTRALMSTRNSTGARAMPAGGLVHTWHYSAPEIWAQLSAEMPTKIDPTKATDVFALSIVFFEVCTGYFPFGDRNLVEEEEVQRAVLKGQRPAIGEVAKVHPGMAQLVQQCWAQDPAKRPEIGDVCSRLESLVSQSSSTIAEDRPID